MRPDHVIAQCRWHTTYDQQATAVALQDFLSHWSNTELPAEVTASFDRLCPPGSTWRIDSLQLELGDINVDELPQELPRRLRAGLQEALDRMLVQHEAGVRSAGENTLLVLDEDSRAQQLIASFLQHGSMPWWLTGNANLLQVFDGQLDRFPDTTIAVIRNLGRAEPVRRRLVWQAGEVRVRRVVRLLEPAHGEFICSYADGLFAVQAERKLPTADTSGFRNGVWLDILGYLLVDRGSFFNTMAFVQANLRTLAQRYQIGEDTLLDQMFAAAGTLASSGLAAPVFIQAIRAMHRQQRPQAGPARAPEPPDQWTQFGAMLRYSRERQSAGGTSVRMGELLAVLSDQDAVRMAALLRQEGRTASVRHGMLRSLTNDELALVVRVLEPQDHEFIIAHAEHTEALAERQRWSGRTVWQVLLAYLLVGRGSHFNRRQLVHDTVLQVCKQRGYAVAQFLDLLIHAVLDAHPMQHRFELLAILHELRGSIGRPLSAQGVHADDWRELVDALKSGRATHRPAARRVLLGKLIREPSLAVTLLREPALRSLGDAVFAQRLLALAGVAHWQAMLAMFEPAAAGFCAALATALPRWHRQGLLPSLDRLDLALGLSALLLQSLPAFRHARSGGGATFQLRAYWSAITGLLRQPGAVDTDEFEQQLLVCLGLDGDSGEEAPSLNAWLLPLLGAARERNADTAEVSGVLTRQQLFAALRRMLTASGPVQPKACEQLWRQLDNSDAIRSWLSRQPDRHHLLQRLGALRHVPPVERWLVAQLPAGLGAPDDALRQWSVLLRESGCWQGAAAVLDRQLHEVFWAVAFDARAQRLDPNQLLARVAAAACLRLGIRVQACVAACLSHLPLLGQSQWRKAFVLIAPRAPATARDARAPGRFQQDYLGRYLDHPRLVEAARHLLRHGRPPAWFAGPLDLARLLFDVCTLAPDRLPAILAGLHDEPAAMFRLSHAVPFGWLLDAMRTAAPGHHVESALLEQLHNWLATLALPGSSASQRQAVLFQLVLGRWLDDGWAGLTPDALASALAWDLMRELEVDAAALRQAIEPQLGIAPAALRLAMTHALDGKVEPPPTTKAPAIKAPPRPERLPEALAERSAVPWRINNAGLVLLQDWFKPLLTRVGLVADNRFVSRNAQRRAVHYLQFLATGQEETPEQFLVLNKLLCGLHWHEPVEGGIEMPAEHKALCESLLESVIGYWSAIGKSSVAGLRGNWLVRDGSLSEGSERWNLVVERRAYDVLLARSPFSYSFIKQPWMDKAVYVTWPTA